MLDDTIGTAEPERHTTLMTHRTEGVTDYTRVIEQLERLEQRYRTLLETISPLIWTTDGAGGMVAENVGWTSFTGQTFEQYSGWGWLEALHPDDREHTQ
ncbi:MAG: PAS domain S-box protein, partial [Bryobacteraceae bacterium]|nr:PAS domain S-box protein [Bryobacteraceae bacterium]